MSTGVLFQLLILGNQILPFTFCPKSAQNRIWIPLLLTKNFLYDALDWRKKYLFLDKKVKAVGIWFPSESRYLE